MKGMTYPKIPTSTISTAMGPDRWGAVMKALKRKYGKDVQLFIAHHDKGPVVHVNSPTGKILGTIRELERWSKKQNKEDKKKH
jgi:hypothetical protein